MLETANHPGLIGIGRVESDVAYGKSFFESLRKEFDMVN